MKYERSYIWTAEKDMNLWLIITVKRTTEAVVKLKPEKNSGLNGIRTHNLCDTGAGALPTELSRHWELVTWTSFLSWKSGRQRQSQIYFLSVGGEKPWAHLTQEFAVAFGYQFEQPGLSATWDSGLEINPIRLLIDSQKRMNAHRIIFVLSDVTYNKTVLSILRARSLGLLTSYFTFFVHIQ